jgi:molybdopterin synthase catalytic subunit
MPRKKGGRLTRKKVDPEGVLKSVGDPGAGAVVLFLGTVRNRSEAGSVLGIAYEAYEQMAEKELAQAEEEVKRRWPMTKGVKIVHRVGALSIGEVSVAVAVSSPHRAEAFEACRYVIERIKHDVPIWKREKLAGGKAVWVEGVTVGSRTGAQSRGAGRSAGRRRGSVAARAAGSGSPPRGSIRI